jgi:hypothetical protein
MSSLAAAVAVGDSTVTLYRVLLYWKDGEDDLSICLMSDNLLRILWRDLARPSTIHSDHTTNS